MYYYILYVRCTNLCNLYNVPVINSSSLCAYAVYNSSYFKSSNIDWSLKTAIYRAKLGGCKLYGISPWVAYYRTVMLYSSCIMVTLCNPCTFFFFTWEVFIRYIVRSFSPILQSRRLSDMKCIVIIWRSWVWSLVGSNLGCVVLLS